MIKAVIVSGVFDGDHDRHALTYHDRHRRATRILTGRLLTASCDGQAGRPSDLTVPRAPLDPSPAADVPSQQRKRDPARLSMFVPF
jgi:hypothetical protein